MGWGHPGIHLFSTVLAGPSSSRNKLVLLLITIIHVGYHYQCTSSKAIALSWGKGRIQPSLGEL